jgi:hypothetical protein
MARSAIVAARAQHHGQFIHQSWIVWDLDQPCGETFLRVDELSQRSQHAASGHPCLHGEGVQLRRAVVAGRRRRCLSLRTKNVAETDVALEQRRVQVYGAVETIDGLRVPAKLV